MQRAVGDAQAFLELGYLKTAVIRNGETDVSPKLKAKEQEMMKAFALKPGQEHFLYEAVSHVFGITPDRDGKIFKKDYEGDSTVVSENVVIEAWETMLKNARNPKIGQPFAYTQKGRQFAGVNRYTVPVVRVELANALCNGDPANAIKVTPQQLYKFGVQEWRSNVRPYMDATANPDQKQVLRDMVDAVEKANGSHGNLSGRIAGEDFSVRDAYDELGTTYMRVFKDDKYLREANDMARKRMESYAEWLAKKDKRFVVDDNGNLMVVREIVENPAAWGLRMVVRMSRAIALMNPVLGIAAIPEHAVSNVTNIGAEKMLRRFLHTEPITKATREAAKREDVMNALEDAMRSLSSGNRAELMSYLANGGHLNIGKESVKPDEASGESRTRQVIDKATGKMLSLGHSIASGKFVLKGADSMRFVEMLSMQMQSMPGSNVNAKSFETMFVNDPVGTMETMLQQPQGMNALLFAMDNTTGGSNMYTEWFQRQMGKSALGEAAFAGLVTKFGPFAINQPGRWLPFTHTFNYLVTMNAAKRTKNETQLEATIFGGSDVDVDADTKLFQDPAFREGLYQNLVVDMAFFGTKSVMLGICFTIIMMAGLEPPDEDELKGQYGEWKIGGVALRENWMMHDLLGFVTPVAVGVAASLKGYDGWTLFKSGAYETITGVPWLKLEDYADMIINFDQRFVSSQEEIDENWGDDAPAMNERIVVGVETFGLQMLGKMFDNPFYRSAVQEAGTNGPEALTPSVNMIYTPDPTDDADATTRTTWADAQFRSVARQYPIVGHWLNFVNGINEENQGRDKTGYLRDQMPLVTHSNPLQQSWMEEFTIDPAAPVEENQAVVDKVIDTVMSFDSPQEAAAYGVVIPFDTRQATYDYLKGEINTIYNDRNEKLATPGLFSNNGKSYDENQLAKSQLYYETGLAINELYAKIDRVNDNSIPYSPEKYNQFETNWRKVYTWKDSGEPASAIDYMLNRDAVNMDMYASGEHKTSVWPWLAVDQTGMYNEESPTTFYNPDLVDPERFKELYDGRIMQNGMFAGQNVYDVVGGDKALTGEGGWKNGPTAGQRALVPVVDYSEKPKLLDPDRDGAWRGRNGEAGNLKDYSKASSSGGYSSSYGGRGYSYSRGGGGGGSSYKPNIYSKPAYSLNADKPATMYAKVPYSAKFDYLRPGFETKGSREAYKRQDI